MPNFTELVKYQKSQGKGNVGSLSSALGQKTLEKLDPRNYLFSRTGLATTLFPSLKGYQAKAGTGKKLSDAKTTTEVSPFNAIISDTLIRVDTNTKITAKNSLVLPMMARDMNLMRLNMQKLVRASGETPSRKADMFFKRASEREAMYEMQYKKNQVSPSKVSGVDGKKDGEKKGFFGTLMGLASSIFSFLPSIFKALLAGGLIAAIIGKLSENKEVSDFMKNAFVGIVTGLFNAMKKGFDWIGENIFGNKEVQESVANAVNSFFGMIKKFLDIKLFDFLGVDVTIGRAFALVIGALASFKLAIAAVSGALYGLAARMSMGGIPIPGGKVPKSGPRGLRFGPVGLALTALAAALGYRLATKDDDVSDVNGMPTTTGIEKLTEEQISERKTGIGVQAALAGAGAVAFGVQAARGVATTALNVATTPPKGVWGKFLDFVAKKSPTLFAKIGTRLATAGAMMAVPGPGWVMTLVSLGLSLYSAYDLYQLWREYNKLETDEQRENAIENERTQSPSPEASSFGAEMGLGPTPASESRASRQTVEQAIKPTAAENQRRIAISKSPTPTGTNDYASRIGMYESGGKYDTVYGQAGGAKINGKPITENTIAEVAAWQDSERRKGTNRHAAGKYQFMDVKGGAKLAGISMDELFSPINQDKMMQAYTNANAAALQKQGIEASTENLAMAHAVGAGGAASLLNAQKSGAGSANALDVLGLTGTARTTNPHLNKSVNEVIASLQSRGRGGGFKPEPTEDTMLAANQPQKKALASLGFEDIFQGNPEKLLSNIQQFLNEKEMGPLGRIVGEQLSSASKDIVAEKEQPTSVIIDNSQTNNNTSGGQQGIQVADSSGVADVDFAAILMRRSADGVLV